MVKLGPLRPPRWDTQDPPQDQTQELIDLARLVNAQVRRQELMDTVVQCPGCLVEYVFGPEDPLDCLCPSCRTIEV